LPPLANVAAPPPLPSPATTIPVKYPFPPVPRDLIAKPPPAGDTNLGWRLAASLLALEALASIGLCPVLSISGLSIAVGRTSPDGGGGLVPWLIASTTVQLLAALGLWHGAAEAKWLMVLLAVVGGAFLIGVALLVEPKYLPLRSPIPFLVAGTWLIVAWLILLGRPTTAAKVTVGFAMVVAWDAVAIGYVVSDVDWDI
jgi:hypothetical protein